MSGRERVVALIREGELYCLTAAALSQGRSSVEVVEAMLAGGARIIQYREKRVARAQAYAECLAIRRMTRAAGAAFIVNDHCDLALAVEADGVHVGQDDLPVEAVRRLVGSGMAIGLSTHGPAQAEAALWVPVDYIGVGPVFPTTTKEDVCAPVGLAAVEHARTLPLPFVAIGGITRDNLAQVLASGARTVAMVREIVAAPDITARVREVRQRLQ
jgi:thiamine-phosphate pyrophosphorylase